MNQGASLDSLKTQILTLTTLKGDGIMNAVWSIIMLSVVERMFHYLPMIGTFLRTYLERRLQKHKETMPILAIGQKAKERTSSISIERDYSNSKIPNDFVDSIIDHISNLKSVKHLRFRMNYFVVHKDEFALTDDIFARCTRSDTNSDGDMEELAYDIYSYTLTIVELRAYLKEIHSTYVANRKNQLGEQRYFFENIVATRGTNNGTPFFQFSMTPFYTNKDLSTIYGSDMRDVITRIRFFIDNKKWYIRKGIPHTLGLLLSGPPGCGKTSLIKAVARETNRHIFHIQLNDTITQSQLRYLFLNEDISVLNKRTGQIEQFVIPIRERIYVMEDVDCMNRILYNRQFVEELERKEKEEQEQRLKELAERTQQSSLSGPQNTSYYKEFEKRKQDMENPDRLTLSFFLNLLDGILEIPDRILVLTSNHPERLDPALIRPGRIDLNINFGLCSTSTILELFRNFFDIGEPEWTVWIQRYEKSLENGVISPAEVQRILFEHWKEPEEAMRNIVEYIQTEKKKLDEQNRTLEQEKETATLLEDILDETLGKNKDLDDTNNISKDSEKVIIEPVLIPVKQKEITVQNMDMDSTHLSKDRKSYEALREQNEKNFREQINKYYVEKENLGSILNDIQSKITATAFYQGGNDDMNTDNYSSLDTAFGMDHSIKSQYSFNRNVDIIQQNLLTGDTTFQSFGQPYSSIENE